MLFMLVLSYYSSRLVGKFNHVVPVVPNHQKHLAGPCALNEQWREPLPGAIRCTAPWNVHERGGHVRRGPHGVSSDRGLFVQELLFAFLCLLALTASWGALTWAGTFYRHRASVCFQIVVCKFGIFPRTHQRTEVMKPSLPRRRHVYQKLRFLMTNIWSLFLLTITRSRHWSETLTFPLQLELDSTEEM